MASPQKDCAEDPAGEHKQRGTQLGFNHQNRHERGDAEHGNVYGCKRTLRKNRASANGDEPGQNQRQHDRLEPAQDGLNNQVGFIRKKPPGDKQADNE